MSDENCRLCGQPNHLLCVCVVILCDTPDWNGRCPDCRCDARATAGKLYTEAEAREYVATRHRVEAMLAAAPVRPEPLTEAELAAHERAHADSRRIPHEDVVADVLARRKAEAAKHKPHCILSRLGDDGWNDSAASAYVHAHGRMPACVCDQPAPPPPTEAEIDAIFDDVEAALAEQRAARKAEK